VDRTPRPSTRVKVDPGAAWAAVEKVRDRRIGENHCCENCFHSYLYPVTPDSPPQNVCHFGPGNTQFIQNQMGLALQTVPRVVAGNFFCHQWKTPD
jgi:hypothetical protein